MIQQLQQQLNTMAGEIPGVLAIAVVAVDDGLSIAESRRREDIDVAEAAAYLSAIVKSNARAIQLLAGSEAVDDILVTTSNYHFIIRHVSEQPFFVFLMTTKEAWLAKARLLLKKYEPQFAEFSEYYRQRYQG